MLDLFFFLLSSLMMYALLVCVYSALLYGVIFAVRKILANHLSVRASYFSWYALLLSFPLAGGSWNDPLKLALYGSLSSGFRVQLICKTIILLWVIAVAIQLLPTITGSRSLKRAGKCLPNFPDSGNLLAKAEDVLGLKTRRIRVQIADFIPSPISFGVITKTILLPADYEDRYTEKELYTLLLHELTHIKNHDTIKLFFFSYGECFFWTLRPLAKYFRRDTELFCDNQVLGLGVANQVSYGELLVKECSGEGALKGLAFSDSYLTLKYRIDGLFKYQPERNKITCWAAVIILIPLLALVYSYFQPASWLTLDSGYNTKFEVRVEHYDPLYDEVIWTDATDLLLTPQTIVDGEFVEKSSSALEQSAEYEQLQEAFEVVDNELVIDTRALKEVLQPLLELEYPITHVIFRSPNIMIDTCRAPIERFKGQTSSAKDYVVEIKTLTDMKEKDGLYRIPLENRGFEENLYLFIARFL
ncbi:beta-lactamase regulating signal transducer with metallopeptidase domain [Lachnospiraceae bacterium PF1-22]|uniref:M56 family metallopeptidase n=1 Tax=Ohessyouella blattaphilus TaxID=2949333 RepID=UPI003E26C59B